MRLLYLCALFLLSINSSAQLKCPDIKIDTTYYHGFEKIQIASITQKCGNDIWVYYYTQEGILSQETRYLNVRISDYNPALNQVLHGIQRTYLNGRLSSEKSYYKNVLCGREADYASNGLLIRENNYICFDSNGKTYSLLHGRSYERDRSSHIKRSEGSYYRGKKHGKWKTYYPNGQVQNIQNFSNGLLTGREIIYHANGQVIRRAHYCIISKNGVPRSVLDGKYREYSSSTLHPVKKGHYKKEKLHGRIKEYHSNGRLRSVIDYKNGKTHGRYRVYFETGKKNIIAKTIQDTGVSSKLLYDGRYRMYAANGTLIRDYRYKKGMLNGRVEDYNSAGELIMVAHYKNNIKHGEEIRYRAGKVIERQNWLLIDTGKHHYSVLHGPFEILHSSQPRKGTYILNRLHGEYMEFYPDGKPKRIQTYDSGANSGPDIQFNENGDTVEFRVYKIKGKGNSRRSVLEGRAFNYSPNQFHLRTEYFYHESQALSTHNSFDGKTFFRQFGLAPDPANLQYISISFFDNGSPEALDITGQSTNLLRFEWYPGGGLKSTSYILSDSDHYSIKMHFSSSGKFVEGRYYSSNSNILISEAEANRIKELIPSSAEINKAFQSRLAGSDMILNYTNGQKMFSLKSNKNVMDGEQLFMNPFGDTLFYIQYKNGLADGAFTSERGYRQITRGSYSKGKKSGHWVFYTGSGYPENDHIYDNEGTLLSSSTYAVNSGIKVRFNEYTNGEEVYWNYNGGLIQEKRLLNKENHEYVLRQFYDDGTLRSRSYMNIMGVQGWSEQFYPNGQLSSKDSMLNSYKNGPTEQYFENGKLMSKGRYLRGTAVGWWEKYDERGNKSFLVFNRYGGSFETLEKLPCSCADSSRAFNADKELSSVFRYNDWSQLPAPLFYMTDTAAFRKLWIKNLKDSKTGSSRNMNFTLAASEQLSFRNSQRTSASIIINPCAVNGYLSEIPMSLNLHNKINEGLINTQRIAIEFDPAWIVFLDTIRNKAIYGHDGKLLAYRQYFRTNGISFKTGELPVISNPQHEKLCPDDWAIMQNSLIKLKLWNAELIWEKTAVQASDKLSRKLQEFQIFPSYPPSQSIDAFNGIRSTGGQVQLDMYGPMNFDIIELMLSNSRLDGIISMEASLALDHQVTYSRNGIKSKIALSELKSMLSNRLGGEVHIVFLQNKAIIYFNKIRY